MGYAAGMAAGFGATTRAGRMILDAMEADRRHKREDEIDAERKEDRAREKKRYEREESYQEDLRRASVEPVMQEKVVGEGGAPVQMDEITGAEVPGAVRKSVYDVGGRQFEDKSQAAAAIAAQSGQMGWLKRTADVHRKHGKVDQALNLEQMYKTLQKEGAIEALDTALAGGTPEAVKEQFNQSGKVKLKDVKVEPFEVELPGFGKVRSAKITGTTEDGKKFVINDALAHRMQFMPIEKKLEVAAKGQESAQRDRQIGAIEKNANTMEQYRIQQAENDRARLGLMARELDIKQQQVNRDKDPFGVKIAGLQKALGRDLTDAEKLAAYGITKGENSETWRKNREALVDDVIRKQVEAGQLPFASVAETRARMLAQLDEAERWITNLPANIGEAARRKAAGQEFEAVQELKRQGVPDNRIKDLGLNPDIKPPQQPGGVPQRTPGGASVAPNMGFGPRDAADAFGQGRQALYPRP
jgi:hypothetical protein